MAPERDDERRPGLRAGVVPVLDDAALHRVRAVDEEDARNVPWTFSTLYSPLLAATWLGDEILVAENPWLAIARQQTVSAVARRKYCV